MAIIFITGVSTAGKTTLYETMRKDAELADVDFRDIDEDGIPAAGSGQWRGFRVELLLHEAAVRFRLSGRRTVICGVTKPHEAIESGSFPADIPVHFVLLDVSFPVIRKRLEARLAGKGWDPQDVEFAVQSNRRLSYVLRRSVQQQRNGIIIDTSKLSRAKVRTQVKQLIAGLA